MYTLQRKLCCLLRAKQGARLLATSAKLLDYLTLVETGKVAEVLLLAELSLYVQSMLRLSRVSALLTAPGRVEEGGECLHLLMSELASAHREQAQYPSQVSIRLHSKQLKVAV